jgi:hypothetical protein
MLSFQATGGGAYKSHIGDYEVFARLHRPTTNTGAVSVALEWAEGDFTKVTRNDALVSRPTSARRLHDRPARPGSPVEGEAGHPALGRPDHRQVDVLGDDLRVDRIWLRPLSESAGEVTVAGRRAVLRPPGPDPP